MNHKLLMKKTVENMSNIYLTPLSQKTLEALLDIRRDGSGDEDTSNNSNE